MHLEFQVQEMFPERVAKSDKQNGYDSTSFLLGLQVTREKLSCINPYVN